MSEALFLAIIGLCLWALCREAMRAGARAYQTELKVRHHQGRDITQIVLGYEELDDDE